MLRQVQSGAQTQPQHEPWHAPVPAQHNTAQHITAHSATLCQHLPPLPTQMTNAAKHRQACLSVELVPHVLPHSDVCCQTSRPSTLLHTMHTGPAAPSPAHHCHISHVAALTRGSRCNSSPPLQAHHQAALHLRGIDLAQPARGLAHSILVRQALVPWTRWPPLPLLRMLHGVGAACKHTNRQQQNKSMADAGMQGIKPAVSVQQITTSILCPDGRMSEMLL